MTERKEEFSLAVDVDYESREAGGDSLLVTETTTLYGFVHLRRTVDVRKTVEGYTLQEEIEVGIKYTPLT